MAFFGFDQRFVSLVLTKRIAASGNEIDDIMLRSVGHNVNFITVRTRNNVFVMS